MAFGVRQKNPETITAAVRLTLELESYLPPPATSITNPQALAQLETCEESKTTDCEITAAISTTARKKVHGDPYCVDDMVWLHSTTIPKGGSKKFHHPWSGPYRVVTKITDNDYRIESSDEKKRTLVVHFNRLKCCVPGTRFSHPPADTADQPSQVRTTPYRCGERIEIVEALSPDTGRYPSRERRPPDRLVETISTVLEFETNSPREEDSVESTYTV